MTIRNTNCLLLILGSNCRFLLQSTLTFYRIGKDAGLFKSFYKAMDQRRRLLPRRARSQNLRIRYLHFNQLTTETDSSRGTRTENYARLNYVI